MIRIALPATLLLAGGCTYEERPQASAPAQAVCTADGLEKLIGKKRSEKVGAEAKRLSGARVLRWIAPGMMVTMDYREDRLNLDLGTDDRIGSVRCG